MILYVVICFHFTIFVVLETTEDNHTMHADRLWFAFILLSLSYWKQLGRANTIGLTSCDLLSFYYLCRTGNNHPFCGRTRRYVVICFHFTIFVVLETTITWDKGSAQGLWFAFILLSLSYWKQQKDALELAMIVVICFHFTIFVVLETTIAKFSLPYARLWFAFILLSLSYWKQRHKSRLSTYLVVICFHFTIFVVLETTVQDLIRAKDALWFAFILLSLSYWKQLLLQETFLLYVVICFHFTIFVVLETTEESNLRRHHLVVICFHFTIFVVLETTPWRNCPPPSWLWFAFILLSLSYWKQLTLVIEGCTIGCDLLSFYYLCRTGNN